MVTSTNVRNSAIFFAVAKDFFLATHTLIAMSAMRKMQEQVLLTACLKFKHSLPTPNPWSPDRQGTLGGIKGQRGERGRGRGARD
mgnify:CR=1 FL=1